MIKYFRLRKETRDRPLRNERPVSLDGESWRRDGREKAGQIIQTTNHSSPARKEPAGWASLQQAGSDTGRASF
jgi:hypothetical protein